jgi:probable rRNA maturation factor
LSIIHFQSEIAEYQYNIISKTKKWLKFVALSEKRSILHLNYYFVDDVKIVRINKEHLNHNFETDIITFNFSFLKFLSGDIFICLPVVKNNSEIYSNCNFDFELMRVIVHGLLHLIGYNDISADDKIIMREKEDYYLANLDRF